MLEGDPVAERALPEQRHRDRQRADDHRVQQRGAGPAVRRRAAEERRRVEERLLQGFREGRQGAAAGAVLPGLDHGAGRPRRGTAAALVPERQPRIRAPQWGQKTPPGGSPGNSCGRSRMFSTASGLMAAAWYQNRRRAESGCTAPPRRGRQAEIIRLSRAAVSLQWPTGG